MDLPFDVLFVVLRTPLMPRAFLISFFRVSIYMVQTHVALTSALQQGFDCMNRLNCQVVISKQLFNWLRCLPPGETNPCDDNNGVSNISKVNLEKLIKSVMQEIISAIKEGNSRFILQVHVLNGNLSLKKLRIKVFLLINRRVSSI